MLVGHRRSVRCKAPRRPEAAARWSAERPRRAAVLRIAHVIVGLVDAALCILLNGFFVAGEFTLVKVRATQLHSRARRGEKKAIVAEKVVSRLDRYLSVTQL